MFSRILFPTDFSEPSDAALAYARALAGKFGASLHVLHVFEPPFGAGAISSEGFTEDAPAIEAELLEEAKSRLQHRVTATDRAECRATTEVLGGQSARAIIDCATERKIDLIIMGTHGRSGVAHFLMGSIAEKVVRTAPRPVMTVRQAPVANVPLGEQLPGEFVPAGG
jgi:nucleotide-binding universal stress UspA family protein